MRVLSEDLLSKRLLWASLCSISIAMIFWNPFGAVNVLKESAGHQQLDFYYTVLLSSPKLLSLESGSGGWAWFFGNLLLYPIALFIDSPLFTLFPFTVFYATLRRIHLDDAQFLVLLWFSVAYIFISQCAYTIMLGRYLINYYVVVMFPPLALYCSLVLMKPSQDMEREGLP